MAFLSIGADDATLPDVFLAVLACCPFCAETAWFGESLGLLQPEECTGLGDAAERFMVLRMRETLDTGAARHPTNNCFLAVSAWLLSCMMPY